MWAWMGMVDTRSQCGYLQVGLFVFVHFLYDASLKKAHQSVLQVDLQLVTFPHRPPMPADTLYPTTHLSTPS